MNAPRFAAVLSFAASLAAQNQALTIYNQDFAVVRDRVQLDLQQGLNDVQFVGVATHLEPDSVVLRDPAGAVQLSIVEQNFRADTISQPLLLSLYEGKELDFLIVGPEGQQRTVRGKVVRSGYVPRGGDRYGGRFSSMQQYGVQDLSPIVEVDGKLRFSLPGQPLFPALTDDAILQPTLHWRLWAAEPVQLAAELSYVTGGISWLASYNFVGPETGDTIDIVGWITMDNRSGKTFTDATIKLMAGDVNKLEPEQGRRGRAEAFAARAMDAAPQVTEKAFDEFHLYSLPVQTTLRNQQQKQVEFVRAMNVSAPTIYVYNGAAVGMYHGWNEQAIRGNPDYGTESNDDVWIMREIANTEENGLGIPLPKGRTRFYRRDDADQRLEFTGENVIEHTPKGEKLRIYTGNAFDVVGERKRTAFRGSFEQKQIEEAFEIRLRNHKDSAVVVRVFERLYRGVNWRIVEKSHDVVQIDAQSIEYRVEVPANGETVVTYRVRYDWR